MKKIIIHHLNDTYEEYIIKKDSTSFGITAIGFFIPEFDENERLIREIYIHPAQVKRIVTEEIKQNG